VAVFDVSPQRSKMSHDHHQIRVWSRLISFDFMHSHVIMPFHNSCHAVGPISAPLSLFVELT
jgi:hypothetical protein